MSERYWTLYKQLNYVSTIMFCCTGNFFERHSLCGLLQHGSSYCVSDLKSHVAFRVCIIIVNNGPSSTSKLGLLALVFMFGNLLITSNIYLSVLNYLPYPFGKNIRHSDYNRFFKSIFWINTIYSKVPNITQINPFQLLKLSN